MTCTREAGHVGADLCKDSGRRDGSDARDGLQQFERLLERGQAALDLYLYLSDGLLQELNVRQDLAYQHQVMRLDSSVERLAQLCLARRTPRARSARTSGSRSPSSSAASMARPLTPKTSLATAASLRLAPSSVFWSRFASSTRSWTNVLR